MSIIYNFVLILINKLFVKFKLNYKYNLNIKEEINDMI